MMNKKKDIFNSEEYKVIHEHYKDWMKEMEEDEKNGSFAVPEKWDEKFRQTIGKDTEKQEKDSLSEAEKERRHKNEKNIPSRR